jgi:hypothetical protein
MGRLRDVVKPRNRLLLGALALALTGCGGADDGRAVFAQAEDGLGRIRAGSIDVHATLHAPVPIERSVTLRADELPLSQLRLTRWAKHPHRIACDEGLECARAGLDVDAALRELDPLLPSQPVDPDSIRSATLEVAVAKDDHLPRRLSLEGELAPGVIPESVPFEVELDLEHA